jgi:phosphoribosylaminoimidazole-succinocarboxamide synthase
LEDHIAILKLATSEQISVLKKSALKVNEILTQHFQACHVRLIDFKLEFGFDSEGKILLADEISPDTCRLWDMDTNEKLDKDVFRRDLGSLTDAYEIILQRLGGRSECTK